MSKRPPSIGEFLAQEARAAVQDIRNRFEEAFYGRVLGAQQPVEIAKDREGDHARHSTFVKIWANATLYIGDEDRKREKEPPTIDR